MNYEEKILTYLDGSFDDNENAELLHQLSVSPEKRVILEQHLQLRSVIAQAGKPYAVPAAIEQQLAARLPILAEYDRDLAGGFIASNIAKETFFARGISAIRGIVASRPVQITGGVIALLALGTFFFANKTSDELHVAPATSLISPSSSPTTALTATPSELANSAASQARDNAVLGSGRSSDVVSSSMKKEILAPAAKVNSANRAHATNMSHRSNMSYMKEKENTPIAQKEEALKNNTTTNAVPADESLFAISSVSAFRDPSPSYIVTNNIGETMQRVQFGRQSESTNGPLLLRVDFGMGQSYFRVRESDAGTTTRLEYTPMIGIDYLASPYFSFGIEGGSAGVSHILPQQVIDRSSGITRVVTSNTIESSNQYYARGVLRFTANPYDMIRVELSAGGGIAFDGANSPLVTASTMALYSLTEKLGISAGFVFSGAFTKANNDIQRISADQVADGEPVGYVQQNSGAANLFVPSVTFRIGFRIKPW